MTSIEVQVSETPLRSVGPLDEQSLAIDGLHDAEALLLEALHKMNTSHPSLPDGLKASVVEAGLHRKIFEAHRLLSELLLPASTEGEMP